MVKTDNPVKARRAIEQGKTVEKPILYELVKMMTVKRVRKILSLRAELKKKMAINKERELQHFIKTVLKAK